MKTSITKIAQPASRARRAFEESGIPVAEWARENGFSASLVYQVLEGKGKCIRGQSHRIAVALGMKEGLSLNVAQLTKRLSATSR